MKIYIPRVNHGNKLLFVFPETFEPRHKKLNVPFKFDNTGASKAIKAGRYRGQILENKADKAFKDIPIVSYVDSIISWLKLS